MLTFLDWFSIIMMISDFYHRQSEWKEGRGVGKNVLFLSLKVIISILRPFHYCQVSLLTVLLLPPQDLKSVMLVCKEWMEMGEDPTLWTWSRVKLQSSQDFHKLIIRRFQLVQELEIGDKCFAKEDCQWTEEDWIELFEMLVNLPVLNTLHPLPCFWGRSSNLSCVDT